MVHVDGVPLLERETELAELERLTERASEGDGTLVYVEGAPGIGKTSLLQAAAGLAGEMGLNVLTARGAQLEQPFAFGIARQLFEPALRSPSADRRRALEGVAQLAEPLIDLHAPTEALPGPDPASTFPGVHALYWLCANLAEQAPLALIVDDAHWADGPSLSWLAYLQRRLDDLPVLVVVGARLVVADDARVLAEVRDAAGVGQLRPEALSERAAFAILRSVFARDVAPEFARACHDISEGNPFLLVELARALVADEIAPDAARAADVARTRPESVSRSVLARLAGLAEETGDLARAVAVFGDGVELRLAAAVAGLDIDAAGRAADRLAASGILAPGRPLSFTHPLIRAAVYDDLPAARRARAHRLAADLLAAELAPAQQVAPHLLHAEPAGDVGSVAILRAAATEARTHGSLEATITYLERALREPPRPEDCAAVLCELGAAERVARGTGIDHLQRALELATDPGERVMAARELASNLMATGRGIEAWRLLEAEIANVGDSDRETALSLEGDLLAIGLTVIPLAQPVRTRARSLSNLKGSTPGERVVLASVAYLSEVEGNPARETVALVRAALGGDKLLHEQTADSPPFAFALATVFAVAEDQEWFDALLEQGYADARRRGSVQGFAVLSLVHAISLVARGDVADAEATARAGLEAAMNAAWNVGVPTLLAQLVHALVERGMNDEAAGWIERFGFGGELPADLSLFNNLLYARGVLRLARSEHEAGCADLIETGCREAAAAVRAGTLILWRAMLAPALAATGRIDEAERLAEEEVELARRRGTARPLGVALRALALVSPEPRRTTLLREAVRALESSSARLEHARALTDLGAALRRANQRTQAREPLRRALDEAHRCGADALVARAQDELAATGARPRSLVLTGADSLTASERRVAKMAARGQSNPEIAQALFITRKTVEKQLTSAYMKLDIGSRSQLAEALDQPPSDAA